MAESVDSPLVNGEILILASDEQNYAFDLWETFRIAIGRHDSNDISLNSRKVSNYHAEILNEAEGLTLRDMRSTNGTFVNDEQIRQQNIANGDTIRIGGYELKVMLKPRTGDSKGEAGKKVMFPVGTRGPLVSLKTKQVGKGNGGPPTFPDLLRVLSRDSRSVTVVVKRRTEEGRIYFEDGRLFHVELGKVRGVKALYRMLMWNETEFEIEDLPTGSSLPKTVDLPFDSLMADGLQQTDEMEKLSSLLPPPVVPLKLKEDCKLPLCDLSPAEIEIFQALIRHETIARVLEESSLSDFRILTLIWDLLKKRVFTVSETSSGLLEETFVYRPSAEGAPAES